MESRLTRYSSVLLKPRQRVIASLARARVNLDIKGNFVKVLAI